MTPEHRQAIDALYHPARELSDEARAALMAHAEPEVREAVEVMLARDKECTAVLDQRALAQVNPWVENPALDYCPGRTAGSLSR